LNRRNEVRRLSVKQKIRKGSWPTIGSYEDVAALLPLILLLEIRPLRCYSHIDSSRGGRFFFGRCIVERLC
jgi:hypothetical protein